MRLVGYAEVKRRNAPRSLGRSVRKLPVARWVCERAHATESDGRHRRHHKSDHKTSHKLSPRVNFSDVPADPELWFGIGPRRQARERRRATHECTGYRV